MRDWKDYKAVLTDIDDTVCPSTRPLSPDMAQAVEAVVRGGRLFGFISGSGMGHISVQTTPYLAVPHQLLAVSGSHYVSVAYQEGRPQVTEIHRREFSQEERDKLLGAFRRLIERHGIRTLTTPEDQLQDRGAQITLSALGRHAPEADKRSFDPDGSRRAAWVKELVDDIGPGYNIRRGGTSSIDITPGGLDKEWGIRRFLEYNHLEPKDALFFGDNLGEGGNDSPALRVVDCVAVSGPEKTLELLQDPSRLAGLILPAGTSPKLVSPA